MRIVFLFCYCQKMFNFANEIVVYGRLIDWASVCCVDCVYMNENQVINLFINKKQILS